MIKFLSICSILSIGICLVKSEITPLSTGLEKLIDKIFKVNHYNLLVRPVEKESGLTFVATELKVLQIDLDEKYQELLSTVWIEMTWTDSRLSWDPKMFDNITEITLPISQIWVPDIVLQNGVGRNEYLNEMKFFNPWISYTGTITWVPEIRLHTRCLIKVSDFPFDTQCCEINFYSWAHTIRQMQITQFDNKNITNVTHLSFNTEWQVYHTCATSKIIVTNADLHWWVSSYVIYIKRHTAYHIYTLIMPCFVLSMLSILLFLLPPDSGEKVTLGVTILLAFFVNSLVVSNYTPEAASDLPVIGMYYVFNIGLVSVSVGTSVCVLNFHFRGHKVAEVPPWIKKFLLIKNKKIKSERIVRKSRFIQPKIPESLTYRSFMYEANTERNNIINMSKADFLSRNKENGFMHPKKLNSPDRNINEMFREDNDSSQSENDQELCKVLYSGSYHQRPKSIRHQEYKIDDNIKENFIRIIKILKKTSKLFESTVNKSKYLQEIYDDWKEVASRLDFVLFIMASLIVIFSPIYLFGKFFLREDSEIYVKKSSCGCNLG